MKSLTMLVLAIGILMAFSACVGPGIEVDTTGMTEDEAALWELRATYAESFEWYLAEKQSYAAALRLLIESGVTTEELKTVHGKIWPLFLSIGEALTGFELYIDIQDPEKAADAYAAFLALKSQLMVLLAKALM
jgi:hypothetical protein